MSGAHPLKHFSDIVDLVHKRLCALEARVPVHHWATSVHGSEAGDGEGEGGVRTYPRTEVEGISKNGGVVRRYEFKVAPATGGNKKEMHVDPYWTMRDLGLLEVAGTLFQRQNENESQIDFDTRVIRGTQYIIQQYDLQNTSETGQVKPVKSPKAFTVNVMKVTPGEIYLSDLCNVQDFQLPNSVYVVYVDNDESHQSPLLTALMQQTTLSRDMLEADAYSSLKTEPVKFQKVSVIRQAPNFTFLLGQTDFATISVILMYPKTTDTRLINNLIHIISSLGTTENNIFIELTLLGDDMQEIVFNTIDTLTTLPDFATNANKVVCMTDSDDVISKLKEHEDNGEK